MREREKRDEFREREGERGSENQREQRHQSVKGRERERGKSERKKESKMTERARRERREQERERARQEEHMTTKFGPSCIIHIAPLNSILPLPFVSVSLSLAFSPPCTYSFTPPLFTLPLSVSYIFHSLSLSLFVALSPCSFSLSLLRK